MLEAATFKCQLGRPVFLISGGRQKSALTSSRKRHDIARVLASPRNALYYAAFSSGCPAGLSSMKEMMPQLQSALSFALQAGYSILPGTGSQKCPVSRRPRDQLNFCITQPNLKEIDIWRRKENFDHFSLTFLF